MTGPPLLSVRGLVAKRGWRAVVDGVDLDVFPGDRIYLHGENGCGKSTLIEALLGLLPCEARSQAWDGAPGAPLSRGAFLDGGVVYVRQHRSLFPSLTLRANLLLRARGSASLAEQKLRRINERFPDIHDSLGRRPRHASAGQRQLTSALRFLMQLPKLLVLDEPTAGISPRLVREYYDLMRRWLEEYSNVAVLATEQHDDVARRWATHTWHVDAAAHLVVEDAGGSHA